jgi:hypothetical protein
MKCAWTFSLLVFTITTIVTPSYANSIIIVPPGLSPGSEYRLAVVTADPYTATSADISTYNSEVNSEINSVAALSALDTVWAVIGSTATVNAINNIGQEPGVPIYDLWGFLVAEDATTNSGGLFSGSTFSPISIDEYGTTPCNVRVQQVPTCPPGTEYPYYVFTGTLPDGQATVFPLGFTGGYTSMGFFASTSPYFIYTNNAFPETYATYLYAISGELMVPESPIPEPSTDAMVFLGGITLSFVMRRGLFRFQSYRENHCPNSVHFV